MKGERHCPLCGRTHQYSPQYKLPKNPQKRNTKEAIKLPERVCRDCATFQNTVGSRTGCTQKACHNDTTTPPRRIVYALDYACNNFTEGSLK